MKNELAQKRTMMMEEMEQEMVRNRQERTELERFKLELNMEKTSLGVDQKNMKVDMDRLTTLGLELRKQSQSLSEAQVRPFFCLVVGGRMVVVVGGGQGIVIGFWLLTTCVFCFVFVFLAHGGARTNEK